MPICFRLFSVPGRKRESLKTCGSTHAVAQHETTEIPKGDMDHRRPLETKRERVGERLLATLLFGEWDLLCTLILGRGLWPLE